MSSSTLVQLVSSENAIKQQQQQHQKELNINSPKLSFRSRPSTSHSREKIGSWSIGKTIGCGSSCKVKLATHAYTKEKCVVKSIGRPTFQQEVEKALKFQQKHAATKCFKSTSYIPDHHENIISDPAMYKILKSKVHKRELYMIREAFISSKLRHDNLVGFKQCVLGQHHFYLFYDYIEGHDLVDYLSMKKTLPETEANIIFIQVLDALEFLHYNNVAHRDIKLENIRYNPKTQKATLLDLGFASFYAKDMLLQTNCGSPCYAPPEIYENIEYNGEACDVWSLGVCLYALLTGTVPFDGPSFRTLRYKINEAKVFYPPSISPVAQNMMKKIFVKDITTRATIAELQAHPFTNMLRKPGVNISTSRQINAPAHSSFSLASPSPVYLLPRILRGNPKLEKVFDETFVSQFKDMSIVEAGCTFIKLLDKQNQAEDAQLLAAAIVPTSPSEVCLNENEIIIESTVNQVGSCVAHTCSDVAPISPATKSTVSMKNGSVKSMTPYLKTVETSTTIHHVIPRKVFMRHEDLNGSIPHSMKQQQIVRMESNKAVHSETMTMMSIGGEGTTYATFTQSVNSIYHNETLKSSSINSNTYLYFEHNMTSPAISHQNKQKDSRRHQMYNSFISATQLVENTQNVVSSIMRSMKKGYKSVKRVIKTF